MSLDIGIGDGVTPAPLQSELLLWMNDDGYYWFLHPLIEKLYSETGQYIDLYGDAMFSGENLSALERMAAEAISHIQAQPATWQVHIATQMKPVQKDVYSKVEKDHYLALMEKWQQIIARAKEIGKPVVCFGD